MRDRSLCKIVEKSVSLYGVHINGRLHHPARRMHACYRIPVRIRRDRMERCLETCSSVPAVSCRLRPCPADSAMGRRRGHVCGHDLLAGRPIPAGARICERPKPRWALNGSCIADNITLSRKHLAICIGLVVAAALVVALAFMFSTLSANLRDISPQTIEYAIDPSVHGTERELLMKAAKQATAMWSDRNPELVFVLTDKQDVLQIRASIPAYVNEFVLAVMSVPADGFVECPIWDTDATACTVYIHPYLLRADTIDYPPAPRINTIAHELGHVLGLSHYPDSNANHLMGTPGGDTIWTSADTKGYVVPERIPLP